MTEEGRERAAFASPPALIRWRGPAPAGQIGLVNEPWLLDEIAHAGPEHLDPAFVAGFDRKQGTDPAPAVAVLQLR